MIEKSESVYMLVGEKKTHLGELRGNILHAEFSHNVFGFIQRWPESPVLEIKSLRWQCDRQERDIDYLTTVLKKDFGLEWRCGKLWKGEEIY